MKKAFYMMAAAAIALSSCSSEETTDVAKSSTITFRPTVSYNSRGAELTTDNLQNMWVTAFYNKKDNPEYGQAYFSDKLFSRGVDIAGFIDPTSTLVWEKNRSYKFVAISPAANEWSAETPTITLDEVKFTNVTPASDIKDQKDLILGTANGSETSTNDVAGVTLNMDHVLSQIKIQVKNQNPNLEYHIKGIRIASVCKSGTYTHSTGAWSNWGEKTKYEVIFNDAVKLETSGTPTDLTKLLAVAPATDCGAMLIPQTIDAWAGTKDKSGDNYDNGAYISILLNVKNKSTGKYMYPAGAGADSDCGWAAVAIPIETVGAAKPTWLKGNKYIYTLDLSKGCGKVDPVNPEEKDDRPIVKPGEDKNPNKGENIFGELIAFKVTVNEWTDNTINIDGTTGTIPTTQPGNSPAKKK